MKKDKDYQLREEYQAVEEATKQYNAEVRRGYYLVAFVGISALATLLYIAFKL